MEVFFKQFLEKHSRILHGQQGKFLLLYIVFAVRFSKKFGIPLEECGELEGMLARFFSGVSGYEIKDAAIAFDQFMPWSVIQQNPLVKKDAEALFGYLYKHKNISRDWLLSTVETLLDYENAGETVFTPYPIRRLISLLAAQKGADAIYDICCGSFLLGIDVWNKMENNKDVACWGEDVNTFMCMISRLMLFLCDVTEFSVREKDVFKSKPDLSIRKEKSAVFVGDLPMVGTRTLEFPKEDNVFLFRKPTLYADWVIIHNVLSRMQAKDRAFLVVTKGALVRENERLIRKSLIERDWVDAVISLPMGLYPGDALPMELIVFEKDRDVMRQGKVLMADLSNCTDFDFDCKEDRILQLAESFDRYSVDYDENFVRIVYFEEIEKCEYSLFPQFYLARENVLEGELHIADVAEVMRGIQDIEKYQYFVGEERYLLNVRDIHNGKVDYTLAEKTDKNHELWNRKYFIREDDIILTARGAVLKVAIVPPNPKPAYISGNLLIVRVNPKKYSPYVLYEYLTSESGKNALELIHTGTTIRVLGNKKLEQLAIPAYEQSVLQQVGELLKRAEIKRMESVAAIEERFSEEKKELLKLLNGAEQRKER